MEELDKLKIMMEELQKQNEQLRAAAGGVNMFVPPSALDCVVVVISSISLSDT